jgi:hypothetical protein
MAMDLNYRYIIAPKPEWQGAWDQYVNQGSVPTEYCTINRSPTGTNNPWVNITRPGTNEVVGSDRQIGIEATAFSPTSEISRIEVSIDGTFITQATTNPYVANITVPASISDGVHALTLTAFDESGRSGSNSVNIIVGDVVFITQPSSGDSVPDGAPISIEARHYGETTVIQARAFISGSPPQNMTHTGGNNYSYQWTPSGTGSRTIYVQLTLSGGGTITSQTISVDVVTP